MKKLKKLSLENEMKKEAEQIEKKVREDRSLDDITVSDEMEKELFNKIQDYEYDKRHKKVIRKKKKSKLVIGALAAVLILVCGIGAGIIQEVVQYIHYETVLSAYDSVNTGMAIIPMEEYLNMMTTVGASGAVYAILLAFGMLFPNQQMFIFPLPVPITAKYFVIGYALIELYAGFANSAGDNVAHFAHLGGMVFGFILIMYWRKKNRGNGYYYN